MGSVQGSQDGGPGWVRNLLRTRGCPDPRRRLEPGGCEQEQICGREQLTRRPSRKHLRDLRSFLLRVSPPRSRRYGSSPCNREISIYADGFGGVPARSEEHTSELQSLRHL